MALFYRRQGESGFPSADGAVFTADMVHMYEYGGRLRMSPLFSNRQSRAGTLVTASMCTAIAVVFSVIGLYIPVFSTLVFLIVPIPIAYMCLVGNMKWGVTVCVAVLLLDSLLFGVMSGAFASSVFCLLGLTLGYGYRKKYSAATILALGTLVSAAVFGAQVFFASAFMGFDPSLFAGKVTPDMQQQMDSMLSAVYSGKELEAARVQSGPMLEMVIRAIPFSLFLVSLFEAWAPMLLCRIIFRRLGIYDIPYFQPFREWQIPVAVIYIYIGVVVLKLALQGLGIISVMWDTMILNVSLVCMWMLWLQGISFLWWCREYKPKWGSWRWPVLIASFLIPLVNYAVAGLGAWDMLTGYRKNTEQGQ